MRNENKKQITRMIFLIAILIFSNVNFVSSQGEIVGTLDATVCCEKTNSGLFCQDVPETDCAPGQRKPPTACSETTFCKTGWCFDSNEGICSPNTSPIACNEQLGGVWAAEQPAACGLGCCVLDDNAAFVTLVRCKKLSGFYGLETNWDSAIQNEALCILTAGNKEKGACVFQETQEFKRSCKFTTRENCDESVLGGDKEVVIEKESDKEGTGLTPAPTGTGNVSGNRSAGSGTTAFGLPLVSAQENNQINNSERPIPAGCQPTADGVFFCPGKLCSAEELETNCAPTRNTICQPGKEEVYFVDTCGNPANIYDSGKINDRLSYWSNIVEKEESCAAGSNNADNQACGNCNYLLGSYCREAKGVQPVYGSNICQSLNCEDTDGKTRLHGESWCVNDALVGAPGSRYFRQICNNGKIRVEACDDFRQEECIEDSSGGFSQAACRVNRWQDCTAQTKQEDCVNEDKRDCKWLNGIEYILFGSILNGTSVDSNSLGGIKERATAAVQQAGGKEYIPRGACVPQIPPGFNLATEEAVGICAQANAVCPVKYEKGLIDDEWEPVEHEECLPGGQLESKRVELCKAIGDCGPKVNYVGQKGSGQGYEIKTQKQDNKKDGKGGLLG